MALPRHKLNLSNMKAQTIEIDAAGKTPGRIATAVVTILCGKHKPEFAPNVVCLGYDQNELEVDLRKWMKKSGKEILLVRLRPYEKEKFHSSLLR